MYLAPMATEGRRIRCYAKVNLGLQVVRRREDGFHDLRTVLHTIDLHDTLEVLPGDGLSLAIRTEGPAAGERLPQGPTNLVLRAARAAGARERSFKLVKRIPAGAGLGGGSSDAAGALLALDRAGEVPLRESHRRAATIGSDVPFFLYGGAALALGRGEEIYPLPDGPPLHLVLAFPGQPLSTLEVYEAWDDLLTSSGNPGRVSDFAPWCLVRGNDVPGVANDLEEAAIGIRPSLKDLRSTLERSGARAVAMTGSGSTFYGIFDDETSAREGARRVEEAGFSAITSRSVGREERDRSLWEDESPGAG